MDFVKIPLRRFLRSLASGSEFGDFDGFGQNLSFLDHSLAVVNWGNHQICLLRSLASGSEFGDLGDLDGFCQNSTSVDSLDHSLAVVNWGNHQICLGETT